MLTSEGRQYAYPCNLGVNTWWGNLDTFRKYGMEAPPKDWNIEEFEKYGVEFVRRANEGKERQDVYFIPSIATTPSIPQMMARGEGVDMYNETLTRATINNPAYIRAFETVLRWTNDLHLAPSAAEVASMSSEGGYGGVNNVFPFLHEYRSAGMRVWGASGFAGCDNWAGALPPLGV